MIAGYFRWGHVPPAGIHLCATFDGNNHNNNGLLVYDAAGNVTMDNMHHYGYDGENRLVSVDSGATAAYVYDAEGKRVRKTTGGLSVDYVYDLAGAATTEMSSAGVWNRGEVYAGAGTWPRMRRARRILIWGTGWGRSG